MFNPDRIFLWCLLLTLQTTLCLAQEDSSVLKKNPFSQPESLKVQPRVAAPPPPPQAEQAPLITEFVLTATLISVNEPMAIVNGELLLLGEDVKGMRLILVDDGRAVIRYQGKLYDISVDDNNNQPSTKRRLR
ncbi:MAG: hypothetical protein ISR73_08965 [Gammaproteobacteria bacterium]|nr:hypothetical protein [Gammaproteobacteria bacterium]